MKRAGFLFVVMTMIGGAAYAQAPAQGGGQRGGGGGRGPAAPGCEDVACDLQNDWQRNSALIIGLADAMPEDKYTFKSTPAQRNFGEHVLHIVQVDQMLLRGLGAKTPAPMINMKATTKADIMAALRQSMEYGAAVLKEFNAQQMTERVPGLFMGPTASRLRLAYFAIAHSQDTYGQMVVYVRLNGITPPASNRP